MKKDTIIITTVEAVTLLTQQTILVKTENSTLLGYYHYFRHWLEPALADFTQLKEKPGTDGQTTKKEKQSSDHRFSSSFAIVIATGGRQIYSALEQRYGQRVGGITQRLISRWRLRRHGNSHSCTFTFVPVLHLCSLLYHCSIS